MFNRMFMCTLMGASAICAASLSGTINDVNGNAVADAFVTVYNPATSAGQDAVTGQDGRFLFTGKDAGQYILCVKKPGFHSIFRGYDLQTDSKLDRVYTIGKNKDSLPPDRVLEQPIEPPLKRVRIGGKVAESNLVKKVQPEYPEAAKATGLQGQVELLVAISGKGVPEEVRVIFSPSDEFTESALEAVGKWRYKPTFFNGDPVEIITTVIFNFNLSQ